MVVGSFIATYVITSIIWTNGAFTHEVATVRAEQFAVI